MHSHWMKPAGHGMSLTRHARLAPQVGELSDYSLGPEHYLVSLSGLPFGVPGQMLSGKLYKNLNWFYRGLLFGMTDRAGWRNGKVGMLSALWTIWDEFDITRSEMTGFWSGAAAVAHVNSPDAGVVRATAFTRHGYGALIVVASWASNQRHASLSVDWERVGLRPEDVTVTVPHIPQLQLADVPRPAIAHGKITLALRPGAGLLFTVLGAPR